MPKKTRSRTGNVESLKDRKVRQDELRLLRVTTLLDRGTDNPVTGQPYVIPVAYPPPLTSFGKQKDGIMHYRLDLTSDMKRGESFATIDAQSGEITCYKPHAPAVVWKRGERDAAAIDYNVDFRLSLILKGKYICEIYC